MFVNRGRDASIDDLCELLHGAMSFFIRTQIYIIIESIVEGSGKHFPGNLVVAALPQKETDPKTTYSRPKTKHGHKVKILNSERGRNRR